MRSSGIQCARTAPKGSSYPCDFSADALAEIGAFFKRTGKIIVALTVGEILNEHIAMKLA